MSAWSVDEITKTIDLSDKIPKGLSRTEQRELLEEIGDYIVFTMRSLIGEGVSPVAGARNFAKLNKDYADKEKKGDRTANMELWGDLMDSLDFEISKKAIEVGWFDSDQAPKAYGHTTGMEGHPWLDGVTPVRKLIPKDDENFKREIQQGINEIIEDFLDAR